jgi:hypothetical protein
LTDEEKKIKKIYQIQEEIYNVDDQLSKISVEKENIKGPLIQEARKKKEQEENINEDEKNKKIIENYINQPDMKIDDNEFIEHLNNEKHTIKLYGQKGTINNLNDYFYKMIIAFTFVDLNKFSKKLPENIQLLKNNFKYIDSKKGQNFSQEKIKEILTIPIDVKKYGFTTTRNDI